MWGSWLRNDQLCRAEASAAARQCVPRGAGRIVGRARREGSIFAYVDCGVEGRLGVQRLAQKLEPLSSSCPTANALDEKHPHHPPPTHTNTQLLVDTSSETLRIVAEPGCDRTRVPLITHTRQKTRRTLPVYACSQALVLAIQLDSCGISSPPRVSRPKLLNSRLRQGSIGRQACSKETHTGALSSDNDRPPRCLERRGYSFFRC